MTKSYPIPVRGKASRWPLLVLLLASLLSSRAAQAQSGPYGNEWIVTSQPYYKVKIWRDGIYRLNYAYLNSIGAGSVAPAKLQLWRRGKEVAIYQGGNPATLDATSYLEFFGQRNDGALDKEFYKDPADHANPHFSFYTDTAAYFITWGPQNGKRMTQPVAAGGTPHGWRLQQSLKILTPTYSEGPIEGSFTYLPWLEPGEGFYYGYINFNWHLPLDSLLRSVATAPGAPAPRLETTVVGGSRANNHLTGVGVIPPGGTVARNLGALSYSRFHQAAGKYTLLPSDIDSNGSVEIEYSVAPQPPQAVGDFYRLSWWRVTASQQNVWFANRRVVAFQNDSLLGGPATYEIPSIPGTVYGYDVQDPWNVQRIVPTAAQTLTGSRYVFPSATGTQTRRLLLADAAQPVVPPPARRVVFRAINAAQPNFVIITHPKLMGAATATTGSVPNAARAYANYRASTAGGRYDTLMVTAPQLYDQFHYGERSVIALRHFALWLAASTPATQTKYLLLLGKGIAPGYAVVGGTNLNTGSGLPSASSSRFQGEQGLDLVPISTKSYSDNFLSSDWPHDNYVPALPTGRVAATTPQQVMDYLNKLQDYESQLDPNQPNPDFWHKQAVNLGGGEDVNEFATFGYYLDKYRKRFESPLLGGKVTTFQRTTTGIVRPIFNISPQVNAGLSLITYFGHGSVTDLAIDLGDVTNPADGYANLHRYPVIMANGCIVGINYFNTRALSTDWMLAANKGSVGFMAETGLSYPEPLDAAQDLSHQLLFNDAAWFGRPVAEVHREVVRRLQTTSLFNPATSFYGLAASEQLLCTVWQGDPALRLFAPAKPDLVVSNSTLSLAPIAPDVAINSASTQFTLNVGVSNPARITRDSVEIRVTRSYTGTGRAPDVYVFNNHTNNGTLLKPFPQAFQRDTVYSITLPNPQAADIIGENIFKVEIDYRNKIAELNETNNTAEIRYSFLKKGLTLLTPTEFAIVGTNTPTLTWQNNDPAAATRGYDMQLDSTGTFANPIQPRANVQAGVVGTWQPTALVSAAGRSSQVWYWRVRFTTPTATEDASWQVGSFRILPGNTTGGWSQSHYGQFGRDQQLNVAQAIPSGRWHFADQLTPVTLSTIGGGLPKQAATFNLTNNYGIRTSTSAIPFLNGCGIGAPNLLVAVLDPLTLARITVPGTYSTCGQNDQTFYHFGSGTSNAVDSLDNLNNSAARRTELLTFLTNIPDGSLVLMLSENRLRFTDPALAPVVARLSTVLGSSLITQLKNGSPWAIVAKKKATGGTVLAEKGPDASQTAPAYSQAITLNYSISTPSQKGTVISTLIGPAQKWQTLMNTIVREDSAAANTSKYRLTLFGVDANNNATVLRNNIGHPSVDLTNYSTTTYPYLRLQVALADTVNRIPPQLKQWLVTYKGLPEGIVRRDLVVSTPNGTFYDPAKQASLAADSGYVRIPVRFDNVSLLDFAAPLQAQISILDAAKGTVVKYQNGNSVQKTVTILPGVLAAGGTATFWVKLDMVGVFGNFTAQVVVNPQVQPELYYFNNYLTIAPFTVSDLNVPPTLDVAVDGRHILDGELVSPTPVISIQLKDEDRLRHVTDASYFTVYLQKGSATPTLVNNSQMQFSVDVSSGSLAKLVYQPGLNSPLADGVYTLRVQGKDPSGAKAGSVDYQIKFEVVNASTISNVYPYPNPVTSKAKFVFTVTGQELPRNMKIQIMTLTGKVVREIFMNELGPLHIGNNITDYAWDGTDQYGDRLANGTYLYRVALDDASGQFQRRATAGDQAFKNDWGKLVLIR
ncbi:MAG: C25 family cysteine peptidase [Janthinobacterium lividum]